MLMLNTSKALDCGDSIMFVMSDSRQKKNLFVLLGWIVVGECLPHTFILVFIHKVKDFRRIFNDDSSVF
jgi:hypothetical protein